MKTSNVDSSTQKRKSHINIVLPLHCHRIFIYTKLSLGISPEKTDIDLVMNTFKNPPKTEIFNRFNTPYFYFHGFVLFYLTVFILYRLSYQTSYKEKGVPAGTPFLPSYILHLYKLCKFSHIPFPQPAVKAFHRDEIILTNFQYRKSLAFNQLVCLVFADSQHLFNFFYFIASACHNDSSLSLQQVKFVYH